MTESETRTAILDAARRLFHEQGYAATGIATILRESGAHPGSLYHFFPSKEALLQGVLEHYTTLLEPIVTAPVERAERDPLLRVLALLAFYRSELVRSGCRMGCPIGNLALEVSDDHPDVRPLIEQNFRRWRETVQRWLEEAGDRLPPRTDREALATFVLTVMEGGVMQVRASGSLRPFDQSVAVLRGHLELLQASARPPRGTRGSARRPRKGTRP